MSFPREYSKTVVHTVDGVAGRVILAAHDVRRFIRAER